MNHTTNHSNARQPVAIKFDSLQITPGWSSLTYHWAKDFQLFLFILIVLTAFRVLILSLYGGQIGDQSTSIDLLQTLWMGFRLDIGTAAAWILITFLVSLVCTVVNAHKLINKARRISITSFAIFGLMILAMDTVFFKVYGDHYNHMILGIVYDDTEAILTTIWKEHHPILFFTLLAILIFAVNKIMLRWMNYEFSFVTDLSQLNNSFSKWFIALLCMIFVVIAMRGGTVIGAPLQVKHLFVTNDPFLNHAILNPFAALRKTIQHQLDLNSNQGLSVYWNPNDIQGAVKNYTNYHEQAFKNSPDIYENILKTATGHKNAKPRHIFMILMESYSGWTLMPAYRAAGFSEGLGKFADQGIHYQNFLPSTRSTAYSLNTLITGLPTAGLSINYEPKSLSPYATSIAVIFKQLGYKTRFFYGGNIGWQRIDMFIKPQGFDEVYSGADVKNAKGGNEWGVEDEYLFSFVESETNDEVPTFNFILTTTNHSPYDMDVASKNFPIKQFPDNIKSSQNDALNNMGHHWYSDRELGKFIENVSSKAPASLFAVTGDHAARIQFQFPGNGILESNAVPFVLYGPDVLKNIQVDTHVAGSHIDIIPTLVELSAEKGFQYPAFGKNMFQKNQDDISWGFELVNGYNYFLIAGKKDRIYRLDDTNSHINQDKLEQTFTTIKATQALSWHITRLGNIVKSPGSNLAQRD